MMGGHKHTPGPWAYRPRPFDDWGWVRTGYAVDREGNQPVVAMVRGGTYGDEDLAEHRRNKTDPWEANARLIAAAPDLADDGKSFLEAVEALCDWMNGNDLAADHADQKPEDFKRLCETMESFRAALAKAAGLEVIEVSP